MKCLPAGPQSIIFRGFQRRCSHCAHRQEQTHLRLASALGIGVGWPQPEHVAFRVRCCLSRLCAPLLHSHSLGSGRRQLHRQGYWATSFSDENYRLLRRKHGSTAVAAARHPPSKLYCGPLQRTCVSASRRFGSDPIDYP